MADSSLTHQAYRTIRADVLACRLAPGERINIKELCDRLQVSLGAVREALSRLTSEGFVIAEPHRGFQVAPISREDLIDLTDVRVKVEKDCLRCSITNGDVQWEARLVSAFHLVSRSPERAAGEPLRVSEDYTAAHHAFHETLVAACESRWMLNIHQFLYHQSERYRQLSYPLARSPRKLIEEHRTLMDAALARDAETACEMIAQHLRRTTEILLESDAVPQTPSSTGRPGSRRVLAA